MSFTDTAWIDNKLIETYGQDIKIKTKVTTTDEEGNITDETYSTTIETKGWIIPFTSLREEYFDYGYMRIGDYSCCIANTISVNINDIIILPDSTEIEVREIVKHWEHNTIAYKELILRKEDTRT